MHPIFLILAAVTILGTAAAMSLRNPIHCILALTAGLVGLAALYLQLGAQFVGFTQILVYVGAVAILAVFAIMMTHSAQPEAQPARTATRLPGVVAAALVFAVLAYAIPNWTSPTTPTTPEPAAQVSQIGEALMHRFVLPLEILALLLTAALIGAVILALPMKQERS